MKRRRALEDHQGGLYYHCDDFANYRMADTASGKSWAASMGEAFGGIEWRVRNNRKFGVERFLD